MYRSILVPLDVSALSEQALPVALSLARRYGAALQLAYVAYSHAASCDPTDAQARAYLEAWAERLRDAGCPVTTVALLDGRDAGLDGAEALSHDRLIAAALRNHAVATGADLVIMTTHSRGEIARLWLGSVADRLVRALSIPILLVRPQLLLPELGREQTFKHVLIPLDGSPQAEAVLAHAVALISPSGARYTLIEAIDPLLAGHTIPPYTAGLTKQEVEQFQAEARRYLESVAERLRVQALDVQTDLVVAEPADGITAFALDHAVDLIAMATHARNRFSQMVLGSTTAKVVHHARAHMLLYRPPPAA